MENIGKHRDLKLVKTERRRNNLVSEPNYHTIKFFSESLFTLDFFYKQLGFCLELRLLNSKTDIDTGVA